MRVVRFIVYRLLVGEVTIMYFDRYFKKENRSIRCDVGKV